MKKFTLLVRGSDGRGGRPNSDFYTVEGKDREDAMQRVIAPFLEEEESEDPYRIIMLPNADQFKEEMEEKKYDGEYSAVVLIDEEVALVVADSKAFCRAALNAQEEEEY